jgi:hypothetical protein
MRFSVDCRRHCIHRRFEGALTRTYTRALLGLAALRRYFIARLNQSLAEDLFRSEYERSPLPKGARASSCLAQAGVAGLGSPCCAPLERCSTMVTRGCKQKLSAQGAAARVLREAMEPSP